MQSFLEDILLHIHEQHDNLNDLKFIVPSKRAATFLNNYLSNQITKPIFAPHIFSIEEFIGDIANLDYASNTALLFDLYASYSSIILDEKDDFNTFLKWGQTLLQDFNEIDRYLIDEKSLFSYLSSIQKLEHWGAAEEQTQLIENYLIFWKNLPAIYLDYKKRLLKQNKGHQGLIYRKAHEGVANYLNAHMHCSYVFIGFNALNTAESSIIRTFLARNKSKIYFDMDRYFLEDNIHSSSYFIRQYKKTWDFFKNRDLEGISSHYLSNKNIQIIGVPKSVSQTKYTGNLLKTLKDSKEKLLKNAALVLADENLLQPMLNSIPNGIKELNITMGLSLHNSSLANFFEAFLELHINKNDNGFFYKDVLKFLSNPFSTMVLTDNATDYSKKLSAEIHRNNWVFINSEQLITLMPQNHTIYVALFAKFQNSRLFLKSLQQITDFLKEKLTAIHAAFSLEQLYHVFQITNQIEEYLSIYDFEISLKSLKSLFFELLSSEKLDFRGNPTRGLQIMGMLETRVLDFETVIITSVNEGILPSGKSNNSFIPYDVKQELGLPTYREKDAIYTYHFYRLLQRAKNIYLIYNTEPDVLEGGEKSRFINQLLTDENINPYITHTIATPTVKSNKETNNSITKSPLLLAELKLVAAKGFSPTSLTNYIRNPLDFYKKSILKINSADEVEESIALPTFGTIIHDSLEDLYRPFIGQILTFDIFNSLKEKVDSTIQRNFTRSNPAADISKGKNLIIYNVISKYVKDFIRSEIAQIKNHEIKLIGVEKKLSVQLNIPEFDFPILLKGKIDRIDRIDGQLRIIDYKTGKVSSTEVELIDWDQLIADKKYNKAFQLLCYAYMYKNQSTSDSFEAGIISIKKLSSGLLKFATKTSQRSSKNHLIDNDVLLNFERQLKKLVQEIFDPSVPFIEKEI